MPTVIGYLFAVAAAASYGGAQVLVRQGLATDTPPLVGVSISLVWGLLGMIALTVRDLQFDVRKARVGIWIFALSGVASTTGLVFMYIALSIAPVVVVSPIIALNPLFTLFFARIFLHQTERITKRLVLGVVLVILGVSLIGIGRTV